MLAIAGPSERAGFIEAPEIGPAKMASSAITPPTAIPTTIPFSFAPDLKDEALVNQVLFWNGGAHVGVVAKKGAEQQAG